MKIAHALLALSLVAMAAPSFASEQEDLTSVCGVRTKSVPLLGSVEYNYVHKQDQLTMEITKLSGPGAKMMISKGLKDGVEEALPNNPDDAAAVNDFLGNADLNVGSKVTMKLDGGKTVITVDPKGVKSNGFVADLLPNLAKVIEGKLASGDGGSRIVPCK
jgi:hypothetical protein